MLQPNQGTSQQLVNTQPWLNSPYVDVATHSLSVGLQGAPGSHEETTASGTRFYPLVSGLVLITAMKPIAARRQRKRRCQRPRGARICAADGPVRQNNPWRDDPQGALEEALKILDTEWSLLQLEIDESKTSSSSSGQGHTLVDRSGRAATLMMRSALDRLRPYCVPSDYIDIPPLAGAYNALQSSIGPDAALVMNFLASNQSLSDAGKKFWQAELYLRRVHQVAGEEDVMEATEKARGELEGVSTEMQQAIRGSILLARQNFISTARFGYFLARARRRWELEKNVGSLSEPDSGDSEQHPSDGGADDFIAALKEKVREAAPMEDPRHSFEVYLADLDAEAAVELVRPATEEAMDSIMRRTTHLFGDERTLVKELSEGEPSQLQLGPAGRQRLYIEAASFGAALFEAEESAARMYSHLLSYTAFGSRASISG
mmetsp:Transcript_39869/g.89418  ORF Transcript_39869/g.89418 Transcript_39869/m.89418 type:complete len:432 (-) Transcript_39869:51-1346(-)